MGKAAPALLAILLFALAGLPACSGRTGQNPAEKITVAVTPVLASASVYLAHEKGYFRDEGLDVTLQSYVSGHLALDAALSGKADFATAADTPIAQAALEGKPAAVIATIAQRERAVLIIARKDKGISAPEDLRGKRIGVTAGTAGHFLLHIYLTINQVDPEDVQTIDVKADDMVDALSSGTVDAVSTWMPYTGMLEDRLGGNALVLHQPGLYTMSWNLVTSKGLAGRNPEVAQKLLRAMLKASRFITKQPAESRSIVSRSTGIDDSALGREWGTTSFIIELDYDLLLNLENQARWMVRQSAGSGRRPPNFMDFIYADSLKAVQPEAVRLAGK